MSNISKYQRLYDLVASKRCSEEELRNVKDLFAGVINSKRRLESIGCLGELLTVLEKRDFLNANNIEPLSQIASILLINTVEESSLNVNVPPVENRQEPPLILPQLSREPKLRAYECIALELGHKWQYFARALGVPEGWIDKLNRTDMNNRIYEILKYYENTCDPRMFRSGLLEGLQTARRKDLSLKVQKIFDTYPC